MDIERTKKYEMFNNDFLYTQNYEDGDFSLYDDIYIKLKTTSNNPNYFPTFWEIDEWEQNHPEEVLEMKSRYPQKRK